MIEHQPPMFNGGWVELNLFADAFGQTLQVALSCSDGHSDMPTHSQNHWAMVKGLVALGAVVLLFLPSMGCHSRTVGSVGAFGPVTAGEGYDHVILTGLVENERLVVMVSVDFSKVVDEGVIPDKTAKVRSTTEHSGSRSELVTTWSFEQVGSDVRNVSLIVIVEVDEGGKRVVWINDRPVDLDQGALVQTEVSEDGLVVVSQRQITSDLPAHGFDNIRALYLGAMAEAASSK